MVAMVGKTKAPHRIRVADTWSARGLASAGMRGTGQPIPAETGSQLKHTCVVFVAKRSADLIGREKSVQQTELCCYLCVCLVL